MVQFLSFRISLNWFRSISLSFLSLAILTPFFDGEEALSTDPFLDYLYRTSLLLLSSCLLRQTRSVSCFSRSVMISSKSLSLPLSLEKASFLLRTAWMPYLPREEEGSTNGGTMGLFCKMGLVYGLGFVIFVVLISSFLVSLVGVLNRSEVGLDKAGEGCRGVLFLVVGMEL